MSPGNTWPDVTAVAASEGRPRGWKRLVLTLAAFAWLFAFAIFLVWSRARTIQLGYDIAHASAENSRLVDEHHSLQLERTTLRSPTRVGQVAATRMGLRPPRPDETVRIGEATP